MSKMRNQCVFLLVSAWVCAEATDCTKTADILENCDQWTECVKSAGVGCYCPNGCTGLSVCLRSGSAHVRESHSMVSPQPTLSSRISSLPLSHIQGLVRFQH